jgi:hypothetical protein
MGLVTCEDVETILSDEPYIRCGCPGHLQHCDVCGGNKFYLNEAWLEANTKAETMPMEEALNVLNTIAVSKFKRDSSFTNTYYVVENCTYALALSTLGLECRRVLSLNDMLSREDVWKETYAIAKAKYQYISYLRDNRSEVTKR